MARATSALTHTLLPLLHRPSPLLQSFKFHSSCALNSTKCKRPILAMARRSFTSVPKTDSVASSSDLQFEGQLKIVEYPDPILRAKNKRVITFDESLKRLVNEMFDIMYRTDGIGLAAPQVGINVQLMVFNPVSERGEGEEIVLVNPQILRLSRKNIPFDEGCLSFPEIYGDVERPDSLKVSAQDISGEKFEVNLTELPARVFQHEYDHLKGILFIDKMSDDVLENVRSELQALEKKYEERTGLPSPEKIDTRKKGKKNLLGSENHDCTCK